jgi:hypothetical protein
MGDVQGNFFVANLGDKKAAETSYRKALGLAESLGKSRAADPAANARIAGTYLKLGDVLANRREALDQYRKGLAAYQLLPAGERGTQNGIMTAMGKIGLTQEQIGDDTGALETYRTWLQYAREHKRGGAVALCQERIAYFSVIQGETEGAEESAVAALRYYEHAENPPRPRNIAKGYKTLAEVQKRTGKSAAALESARKSLKMTADLLAEDPKDQQKQIDYAQAMLLLIGLLPADGQEAREQTARALRFLKPLVEQPDASDYQIQDYVWLLVTTPFQDLRDDAAALRHARTLVSMTREAAPDTIDVLARAYDKNGDLANAVETERKALALLPAIAPGARPTELRTMLETNLQAFQSRLAHQK